MTRSVITDQTLDRLSDELQAMAAELLSEDHFNVDDRKAARDLADDLATISVNRLTLAMLADLLSRHATRESALAEITRTPS